MKKILAVVGVVLLLGALPLQSADSAHRINLYVDADFDIASRDSSGADENVNTRIAAGYLINGHWEAGIQAAQDAEDRSVQDIGFWGRFNLGDRDSTETVLYARGAVSGILRDLKAQVEDDYKIKLELASGVEMKMSQNFGAYAEADIRYLWDAEKITEMALHAGMVAYLW